MQFKNYLVFLAISSASGALADARFVTDSPDAGIRNPLVYAQAQIEDIGESDMRRLVFYAERATRALRDIIDENGDRTIIEQDQFNARFREATSRLADAGARSGLSMDQVADFFTAIVFETFGQAFMQQVGSVANGMDFRTLFRNVSTVQDPRTSTLDDGSNFLNALANVGNAPPPEAPPATVETVTPVVEAPQGPVPFPNAGAVELNIIERVKINQGRWEITIRSGDSLSAIASAIYGNSQLFNVIYNANSNAMRNPNVVDVGTVLVLPKP